jgi:hypothetical protein
MRDVVCRAWIKLGSKFDIKKLSVEDYPKDIGNHYPSLGITPRPRRQ